jgi:hypothetical protein
MIKFNETYTVNNGQESIVFAEGKGNTITGEYNDGTLTGTMEGDVLKATFHNKKTNGAGLIELTFHENGFNAKWKLGLEPGPMKGKWNGELKTNTPLLNKDENKSEEFNIQELANKGVFSFSKKLNEILDNAKQLDEDAQYSFMSDFFTQLENFVSNNPEFVYLDKIAIKVTQDFYNNNEFSYFPDDNEEHREKYCFDLNSLRNKGLISLVISEEKLDITKINSDENQFNNFLNLLSSYFIYSIESIVAEDEAEELAEFVLSISSNTFEEITDYENYIVDQILDVLNAYGFNINDYEGDSEIYANYYLRNSINSGYDYITFCEDIIRDLYCD